MVVGIAHIGDAKSVGRVFGKATGWFVTASLVSLVPGLIMAKLLEPSNNLGLPLPHTGAPHEPAIPHAERQPMSTTTRSEHDFLGNIPTVGAPLHASACEARHAPRSHSFAGARTCPHDASVPTPSRPSAWAA